MKPLFQTKMHVPENGSYGNCYAACFASILEIPLSDIPEFEELPPKEWHGIKTEWLERIGLQCFSVNRLEQVKGFSIVTGMGTRGIRHCVVYLDGEQVHDPYPHSDSVEASSVEPPLVIEILVPLDPSVAINDIFKAAERYANAYDIEVSINMKRKGREDDHGR